MRINPQKLTLTSVFFTFFVDSFAWAIVFPIFAPYFLDPQNRLFSPETSLAVRTTLLGFFLMAFSLGQFFGAPALGEYADRRGRKRAFLVSIFFTFIGLVLSAWGIQIDALWLLFLGRLVTGIFAGSLSICLACVSDLNVDSHAKVKHFGYLATIAGISFVFGAFIGGKLSDPSIYHAFSPELPLWLAAVLTLLNFFYVSLAFRETRAMDPAKKLCLWEAIRNLREALKTEKIKRIYAIYFLFLFSWTILFQFIPVLVVDRFHFTNSNIGDMAIYMGACWAIGAGYLNKGLLRIFSEQLVLEFCFLSFTMLTALIILPKALWGVLLILGLCVVVGGLAWPLCTNVISNQAPSHIQGKILGMSQAVQSMAMASAPLLGGLAYHLFPAFPFLLGAGFGLIASILYFLVLRK
jgi:DHA1 family tetracycline resistance protein-like MFS transporter